MASSMLWRVMTPVALPARRARDKEKTPARANDGADRRAAAAADRGTAAHSRVTFNRMKTRGWPPAGSLKQCSSPLPESGMSTQLSGSKVALHWAP